MRFWWCFLPLTAQCLQFNRIATIRRIEAYELLSSFKQKEFKSTQAVSEHLLLDIINQLESTREIKGLRIVHNEIERKVIMQDWITRCVCEHTIMYEHIVLVAAPLHLKVTCSAPVYDVDDARVLFLKRELTKNKIKAFMPVPIVLSDTEKRDNSVINTHQQYRELQRLVVQVKRGLKRQGWYNNRCSLYVFYDGTDDLKLEVIKQGLIKLAAGSAVIFTLNRMLDNNAHIVSWLNSCGFIAMRLQKLSDHQVHKGFLHVNEDTFQDCHLIFAVKH